MDISELARASGLPASTLRYYEERGMIRSVGRKGLKRLFTPDALQKVALITLARQSGFSLAEISGMFDVAGEPSLDRSLFADKAAEVQATIEQLCTVRDSLDHMARCSAPDHWQCPEFRRILGGALPVRSRPSRAMSGVGAKAGSA